MSKFGYKHLYMQPLIWMQAEKAQRKRKQNTAKLLQTSDRGGKWQRLRQEWQLSSCPIVRRPETSFRCWEWEGGATTKKPVSPGRPSFKSERKIKAFFFFKPRKKIAASISTRRFSWGRWKNDSSWKFRAPQRKESLVYRHALIQHFSLSLFPAFFLSFFLLFLLSLFLSYILLFVYLK